MDKERQIEEMKKILGRSCLWQKSGELDCLNCEYFSEDNHVCCSFGHKEAEMLYKAGYGDTKAAVREFAKKLKVKLCESIYADEDIRVMDKWFSSKELISEIIDEQLKEYEE